jgi:hypothetical protein
MHAGQRRCAAGGVMTVLPAAPIQPDRRERQPDYPAPRRPSPSLPAWANKGQPAATRSAAATPRLPSNVEPSDLALGSDDNQPSQRQRQTAASTRRSASRWTSRQVPRGLCCCSARRSSSGTRRRRDACSDPRGSALSKRAAQAAAHQSNSDRIATAHSCSRPFPSVPGPTAANPRTYALTIGLRPRASGLRGTMRGGRPCMWQLARPAAIVGRETCDRAAAGTQRRRRSRGCLCPDGSSLATAAETAAR